MLEDGDVEDGRSDGRGGGGLVGADRVRAGESGVQVRPRGPGDVRRLATTFNQMAERLDSDERRRRALLADLATLSTAEAGALLLEVEDVAVPDVAGRAVRAVADRAAAADVAVTTDLAADLPRSAPT